MVGQLRVGEYKLVTLKQPYPGFRKQKIAEPGDWEQIKAHYRNRCATCGSEEGSANIHYPGTKTTLHRSHRDPNKPLGPGNIIPQCQKCNRADRDNWVYNDTGRVIKVANPNVIKKCDPEVQRKIYKLLYQAFRGANPLEW